MTYPPIHMANNSNLLYLKEFKMIGIKDIIGTSMGKNSQKEVKEKAPPHELSATTNLIDEAGLFTKKYGRSYWLGKVKRSGVSYSEMIGILKEIRNMPAQYSKGGRLTNLLTAQGKKNKDGKKTN